MKKLLVLCVAGVLGFIYFYKPTFKSSTFPELTQSPLSSPTAYAQNPLSVPNISEMVEKRVESVVNIASIKITRYQNISPFFNDPFFKHFFGDNFDRSFGMPRERRQQSLGSGVLVSKDGYILTNNHVVANATEVLVRFSSQTEIQAKVIGTDPQTDLALLQVKIPNKDISPIPLGDSDNLRLAETVLAIGSPFGLGGTVTLGIVSAKGRANVGIVEYEDFIQTDAAINPGNSGGALINTQGELVGINTAIYSKSGGYQGIGFAVPINMAKYVMAQLIQNGEVTRGWIGTRYQDINSDIAKALNLKLTSGVVVTGVFENSPAAKAGIKSGDAILKFNGETLRNSGHFSKLLSETPVGKSIELETVRDGKSSVREVVVENVPEVLKQRQNRSNRRR